MWLKMYTIAMDWTSKIVIQLRECPVQKFIDMISRLDITKFAEASAGAFAKTFHFVFPPPLLGYFPKFYHVINYDGFPY